MSELPRPIRTELSKTPSSSSASSATSSSSSSSYSDEDSSRSSSIQSNEEPPSSAPSVGQKMMGAGSPSLRVRQMSHRNPELQFERPDSEYIPLPPLKNTSQIDQVLRIMVDDVVLYPWGKHRVLDYFRTAVNMFIAEVVREYRAQTVSTRQNGRTMSRFIWKNTGELAVCFACCCDMLKLLFVSIRPGPAKPVWDNFANQLAPLLMSSSRIPPTVLGENTYRVKFMDWQKGGTRYNGGHSSANVRFPSASERQVKVELYLRNGSGYTLQTVVVDPSTLVLETKKKEPREKIAAYHTVPPALLSTAVQSNPPAPTFPVVRGPPLRLPAKSALSVPSASQTPVPEEMRHMFWVSALAHVKGGEPTAGFPDDRAPLLTGFGRLCDMAKTADERLVLVRVIKASSPGVQTIFERLGGVVSFRKFATYFISEKSSEGLMEVVDTVARLRTPSWGKFSQEHWCMDVHQQQGLDLHWLRELPLIPAEKRPAWGALLLMMEEKFIFTLPRETIEARQQHQEAQQKANPSLLATAGLSCAAADNTSTQLVDFRGWKWHRVHTFQARRLPDEFRAPLLKGEQDGAGLDDYITARKKYFENEQARWRNALIQMIDTAQKQQRSSANTNAISAGDIPIPLWYDPLELLNVAPPLKSMKLEEPAPLSESK